MKPFDDLLDERFTRRQRAQIERAAREKVRAIRLGELREQLGLRQEDVADELGVSQSGVSRIELRKNLRIETLRRYLEALGGRLEVRHVAAPLDPAEGGRGQRVHKARYILRRRQHTVLPPPQQ